jgi:hypothetical protein
MLRSVQDGLRHLSIGTVKNGGGPDFGVSQPPRQRRSDVRCPTVSAITFSTMVQSTQALPRADSLDSHGGAARESGVAITNGR